MNEQKRKRVGDENGADRHNLLFMEWASTNETKMPIYFLVLFETM